MGENTKWRAERPVAPYEGRHYGATKELAWARAAGWSWSGYIRPPTNDEVPRIVAGLIRDGWTVTEVPADEPERDLPYPPPAVP